MSDTAAVVTPPPNNGFMSAERLKTILVLAVPVLATMLSTNLMGLIDTGMIGQLGNHALAGVSVASNLFFMAFALIMGVSAGVQITVARRLGEGDAKNSQVVLNAGIAVAAIGGLAVLAIGYLVLPLLTGILNNDPLVVENARAYLLAILPSVLIGGISTAFAGYWLGTQRPVFNLLTVVIQLVCNALFNYMFIFGNFGMPRLEMVGAGLGTTLAHCVALLVNVAIVLAVIDKGVFLRKFPDKARYKALLTFSVPMGIQQFLFILGMVVFVFIVGHLGTQQLAAFQVIIVIMMTSMMLAIGLGTIATTLVSGALGQKNIGEASQWGWEVSTLGAGALLVVGVLLFFWAEDLLNLFIADPATAAMALVPLRIMIVGIWVEAFGRILGMALVGAGAVGTVFKITFANQWFLRLPLYWLIGVYWQQGLVGIFVTMLVLYILQTSLFVFIWRKRGWGEIPA